MDPASEDFVGILQDITKIQQIYLRDPDSLHHASLTRKLSWPSCRQTTRKDDAAYCLMGLLNVNMPLLYGEGAMAFIRLQEEVIKIVGIVS
ncbi:hypothetical protein AC579_6843 [Pseudocercospora musae]|uniref:Uncharacterized protein n=1 Tax=Pseudocercospora musae TaxID=113226 RepID=A0A139I7L5_9PEZI|nr:hypothetical protein AC579_6843 [Pseudocercospora musae]